MPFSRICRQWPNVLGRADTAMMGSRARVAAIFFKSYAGEVYGGGRRAALMLSRLEQLQPVALVNVDDGLAAQLRRDGIPVHVLPIGDIFSGFGAESPIGRLRRLASWARYNLQLLRLLRRLAPDVVYACD